MLNCLNSIIKKIDYFQEDCSTFILTLKHLLGESSNSFSISKLDEDIQVYKNSELILTEENGEIYVEPKFNKEYKIINEAMKFLKKSMKESAEDGPLGGYPARVDGQQLGGRSKEQLEKSNFKENDILKAKSSLTRDVLDSYDIPNNEMNLIRYKPVKVSRAYIDEHGDKIVEVELANKSLYPLESKYFELATKKLNENGGTSVADIATVPQILGTKVKKRKNLKEGLVAGASLPAQDATVNIQGGKAKVSKVAPSKASGLQKTITVVDTGQ